MEGNKKINLKEAAEICGYDSKYLSRLIRSGKIKGEKIGKSWFIKEGQLNSIFPKKKVADSELEDFNQKEVVNNYGVSAISIINQSQLVLSAIVLLLTFSFIFSILLTLGVFSNASRSTTKDSNYVPTGQEEFLRHSIFGD